MMRLSKMLALVLILLLLRLHHVVGARAAFLPIPPALQQQGGTSSPLYALSSALMDPIIEHPAMSELLLELRPRSRLKEHHTHYFIDDKNSTLFNELALVACRAGVVCRKELLETYAAATYMHAKFRNVTRMADLAAGHGLLSWFLLAFDEYDERIYTCICKHNNESDVNATNELSQRRRRTVVCVDRRMPSSATVIAAAMTERFPALKSRWSYIQSDLSDVIPHPSCLLTSVHACGTLSDFIIHMAMDTGAPLAIVPCCHTVKERMGYQPHILSGKDAKDVVVLVEERKNSATNKHDAVADVVDEVRCRTLRNAGYAVEEVLLPEAFTARNRVILGERPRAGDGELHDRSGQRQALPKIMPLTMPPLLRTNSIPLADDAISIAQCHAISGKAVTKTTQAAPPRHFSMRVSIWLESDDDSSSSNCVVVTVEMLQTLATQICGEHEKEEIQCTVEPFGEVNVHATTGRSSQLYSFKYTKQEGGVTGASRVAAKRIHGTIRESIATQFGEDVLR
jgi:hypothetical protein